jgi:hypothetical protein
MSELKMLTYSKMMLMDIPFLWLLPLLLYISLGTIVDVLISSNISNRILSVKINVFVHILVKPLIFSLIVISTLYRGETLYDLTLFGAVLLSVIIRSLVIQHRYFVSCDIEESVVTVWLLTAFFRMKSIQYDRKSIDDIEVHDANWLKGWPTSRWFIDFPGSMNIKYKGEWVAFEVLNRKLKDELNNRIVPLILDKTMA